MAAIGVDQAAATAFRAVALVRARDLAQAHASLFQAAWGSEGVAALAPRWRSPWAPSWRSEMTWAQAKALALAGVARVHPRLGRRAQAVVRFGRVHISQAIPPQTRPSRFGPPHVFTRFTGDSETALVLAHELGHAAQMTGPGWGPGAPAPHLAACEVAAHVAERGFHRAFQRKAPPRAAAARIADDMLTMLVRHPARDALEHARPGAWGDICDAYAPTQAWATDPPPVSRRAIEEPLSTLGYAMAATLATVLFDRIERDTAVAGAYLQWVLEGPAARIEDAAALVGARMDDPGLFDSAYDLAIKEAKDALDLT